jgi:tetratricopeptide (TPR) repeat protein
MLRVCRHVARAVLIAAAIVASGSVMADALDTCLDSNLEPAARIEACTASIESAGLADSELAAAVRERGLANIELGNHRAAIPDLTRATRLEPADVSTWMAKAHAFLEIDSLEGARRDFRQVLLLEPENAQALRGCTDVLAAMGYENPAEAARENACAIVSLDANAYAAAQRDREETLAEESSEDVPRKARVFGDDVLELLARMEDSRIAGDAFRAAIYYTRAVEADPDAAYCMWETKGGFEGLLLRQYDMVLRPDLYGDSPIPRTLPEIQAILSDNPRDPDALRERGLLFAASGGATAAADDLDKALEADPESVELMVLNTKAHLDVLESQIYWSALSDSYRRHVSSDFQVPRVSYFGTPNFFDHYYKPEEWLATIERAIALGADDFFTHLTYRRVLEILTHTKDPSLADDMRAEFDRAIERLPTWPEGLSKRVLGFKLYSERAVAGDGAPDFDAYMDAMDLAMNPPGVESDLYDPRCYEP